MRTTIDIPDEAYRNARIVAAQRGSTMRMLVLEGLEIVTKANQAPRKLQLPLIRSSRPGTLELTNEQIDELTAFS
jgi:hypothetical protein